MVIIYTTPLHQKIIFSKDTTLTALANYRFLELLKNKLVKKQRKNQVKNNNKAFTGAKVLYISDIIKQAEKRREKNKRRRRTLGKKHLKELLTLQSRFSKKYL